MKFAAKLDEYAVAEWTGQYINYRVLKKLLKKLHAGFIEEGDIGELVGWDNLEDDVENNIENNAEKNIESEEQNAIKILKNEKYAGISFHHSSLCEPLSATVFPPLEKCGGEISPSWEVAEVENDQKNDQNILDKYVEKELVKNVETKFDENAKSYQSMSQSMLQTHTVSPFDKVDGVAQKKEENEKKNGKNAEKIGKNVQTHSHYRKTGELLYATEDSANSGGDKNFSINLISPNSIEPKYSKKIILAQFQAVLLKEVQKMYSHFSAQNSYIVNRYNAIAYEIAAITGDDDLAENLSCGRNCEESKKGDENCHILGGNFKAINDGKFPPPNDGARHSHSLSEECGDLCGVNNSPHGWEENSEQMNENNYENIRKNGENRGINGEHRETNGRNRENNGENREKNGENRETNGEKRKKNGETRDKNGENKEQIRKNAILQNLQRDVIDLWAHMDILEGYINLNTMGIFKILKKREKIFKINILEKDMQMWKKQWLDHMVIDAKLKQNIYSLYEHTHKSHHPWAANLNAIVQRDIFQKKEVNHTRVAFFVGACSVLLMNIGVMCHIPPTNPSYDKEFVVSIFPFFRLSLVWVVLLWCAGACVDSMDRYGVNYKFMLEMSVKNVVSGSEIYVWATCGSTIWIIGVGVFLLDYRFFGFGGSFLGDVFYLFYPFFVFIGQIVLVLLPSSRCRYKYRKEFLKNLYRVFLAAFFALSTISLGENIIGDILTSLPHPLADIQYICAFSVGLYKHSGFIRSSGSRAIRAGLFWEGLSHTPQRSYIAPLIYLIPQYLRMCQCVIRFKKERERIHIYNVLKYAASITVVFTSLLPLLFNCEFNRPLWLCASLFASLYMLFWDIFIDWGFWEWFIPNPERQAGDTGPQENTQTRRNPGEIIMRQNAHNLLGDNIEHMHQNSEKQQIIEHKAQKIYEQNYDKNLKKKMEKNIEKYYEQIYEKNIENNEKKIDNNEKIQDNEKMIENNEKKIDEKNIEKRYSSNIESSEEAPSRGVWPPVRTMLFPNSYHLLCLGMDILGRCTWAVTLTPLELLADQRANAALLNLLVSIIELLRRAAWVGLRLQHEHLTNASKFRSLLWVPRNT